MPAKSLPSPQWGDEPNPNHDIRLAIVESGSLRVFHLSASDERVITVGATTGADIQFDAADISPIHFYFERLDDDVWIVPAYCVSGLRVNSTKVTVPQRLGARAKVEFGSIVLDLEVTYPNNGAARSGQYPDLCESSSDLAIGEDSEPTHQAWPTGERAETHLERSIVTLMVPRHALVSRLDPAPNNPNFSEFRRCRDTLSRLRTVPIAPIPLAPAVPPSDATIRISSIRAVPPDDNFRISYDAIESAPIVKAVELPSLKRTLYGVSPSLFGTDSPRLAPPHVRCCVTESLALSPLNRHRLRRRGALYQLGQLGRRRPLAVFATAVICALLGAAMVVLATDAMIRARSANPSSPFLR